MKDEPEGVGNGKNELVSFEEDNITFSFYFLFFHWGGNLIEHSLPDSFSSFEWCALMSPASGFTGFVAFILTFEA